MSSSGLKVVPPPAFEDLEEGEWLRPGEILLWRGWRSRVAAHRCCGDAPVLTPLEGPHEGETTCLECRGKRRR